MFAKEFVFNIDGGSFRTPLGGAFSILLAISFLGFTAYFGKDMYLKTDPNYLFKFDNLKYTPFINFTKDNFIFAFNLMSRETFEPVSDFSSFFVELDLSIYKFDHNSTLINTEVKKLDIKDCSPDIIPEPNFSLNKFGKFKCLTNFKLGGDPDFGIFHQLEMYVKRCSDIEEKKYNIKCLSDAEIESKRFAVEMKIQKDVLDPLNYEEPIKTNFAQETYYIQTTEHYISNVKFHKSKLTTDGGIIFEDFNHRDFFEFYSLDFRSNGKRMGRTLMALYMFLTKDLKVYTRNYLKFVDLVANIGGFMSLAIEGFRLTLNLYIENEFNLYLYNHFFSLGIIDETEDCNSNLNDLTNRNILINSNITRNPNLDQTNINVANPLQANGPNQTNNPKNSNNPSIANDPLKSPILSINPSINNPLEVEKSNLKEADNSFDVDHSLDNNKEKSKIPSPTKKNKRLYNKYFEEEKHNKGLINKDISNLINYKSKKFTKVVIGRMERYYFLNCNNCRPKKKKYNNSRFELLVAAEGAIENQLDVVKLFHSIDEFNLFKQMLLNEDQEYLLRNREAKNIYNTKAQTLLELRNIDVDKITKKKRKTAEYLRNKQESEGFNDIDKLLLKYLDKDLKDELQKIPELNKFDL